MSLYIPHYRSDSWLLDFSNSYRRRYNVTPHARAGIEYRWRRILLFRLRQDATLLKLAYFGSTIRGTDIPGFSDTDILTVLAGAPVEADPKRSFEVVESALSRACDGILDVYPDYPAVRIFDPFENVPIDFIPAHRVQKGVYVIADTQAGGWIETAPSRQNKYILETQAFNSRAVHVIRLMKLWNYFTDSRIASIYLELFVAEFLRARVFDSMLDACLGVFRELSRQGLSPINDPSLDQALKIFALPDESLLERVFFLLDYSIDRGYAADAAEKSHDSEGCIEHLRWMFPYYDRSDQVPLGSDRSRIDRFVSRFGHDPRYAEYLSDRRRRKLLNQRRGKRLFRP